MTEETPQTDAKRVPIPLSVPPALKERIDRRVTEMGVPRNAWIIMRLTQILDTEDQRPTGP